MAGKPINETPRLILVCLRPYGPAVCPLCDLREADSFWGVGLAVGEGAPLNKNTLTLGVITQNEQPLKAGFASFYVNGKLWKWDFNSHFGPNFLRKGGKALAVQPSEKSHAWPIFEEWHKRVWEEVKPDGGNDKAGDDRP